MLEHASPLVKVTIVPRGKSLGAAWYLPEERLIVRPEQMLDEMCAALGGRAAEKIVFNTISTGALSDLEKVTKQARAMVTIYGLNEKVGNLTYYDSSNANEYGFTKGNLESGKSEDDPSWTVGVNPVWKFWIVVSLTMFHLFELSLVCQCFLVAQQKQFQCENIDKFRFPILSISCWQEDYN